MNYLGLTKQERVVILFLLCFGIIGGALKLYKSAGYGSDKNSDGFLKQRHERIRKFKERAKQEDTLANQATKNAVNYSSREQKNVKAAKKRNHRVVFGKQKIDINTASISELVQLPAIGPVKAKAIIKYREKIGRFKQIKEILAVKGIGTKTFKKIAPFIVVK